MPRTKEIIQRYGRDGLCLERVTERFTHRQTLDDGRVILADPANAFWRFDGMAWYGKAPEAWDEWKAFFAETETSYDFEADYS